MTHCGATRQPAQWRNDGRRSRLLQQRPCPPADISIRRTVQTANRNRASTQLLDRQRNRHPIPARRPIPGRRRASPPRRRQRTRRQRAVGPEPPTGRLPLREVSPRSLPDARVPGLTPGNSSMRIRCRRWFRGGRLRSFVVSSLEVTRTWAELLILNGSCEVRPVPFADP